jgi:hypothetical protein
VRVKVSVLAIFILAVCSCGKYSNNLFLHERFCKGIEIEYGQRPLSDEDVYINVEDDLAKVLNLGPNMFICGIPVLKYDAYLTWKRHKKTINPDDSIFIYNGKCYGLGSMALNKIYLELKRLKPNSKVLIFPEHDVGNSSQGFSEPMLSPPIDYARMRELAVDKKLILLFSNYDDKGAACPHPEPIVEDCNP